MALLIGAVVLFRCQRTREDALPEISEVQAVPKDAGLVTWSEDPIFDVREQK